MKPGASVMNAIVFDRTGSWNEVLRLAGREIVDPGADEVQVRIVARPINPSDRMFIAGSYRQRPELPQVAGLEGAGVVEKVGRNLDPALAGKHVSFRAKGTWAERINLPAGAFREIPAEIPFEAGCQLSLNLMSAHGLLERVNLAAGQWLLLTAANSSLGKLIVQLAKPRGIRVLALVRRPENRSLMLDVGADTVLVDSSPNLLDEILETTGGGANGILDAVGGRLGSLMLKAAAPLATVVLYGRLSPDRSEFDYGDVIYRNLRVEGFGIDRWQETKTAGELDRIWRGLAGQVASGSVTLTHDMCFELEDFKEAIACYEKSGGKVILK